MSITPALVSVAMATYNGEKYLKEQLDSLLQQTWLAIEIVITDDGSKDSTVAIIKTYQQNNASIFLFENEQNKGITKTFENSISHCTGAFIALCDQDDIWELDKINTLVNAMGKEDAVYSNSLLVNQFGQSLGKDFKQVMNMQSYYSGAPFLLANCIPGHTLLVKSDFMKKILPLPAALFFDNWISFCAASNNGVKYVDRCLVKYRQHETNTVGVSKLRKNNRQENRQELFDRKLQELKIFETAPITSAETKSILHTMIGLFTPGWSLRRSLFFFSNIDTILVVKNKPYYRKVFYCIKMIFKANY